VIYVNTHEAKCTLLIGVGEGCREVTGSPLGNYSANFEDIRANPKMRTFLSFLVITLILGRF